VPVGAGRTGYEGPGPTLRQPHRPTANVPANTAIVEHGWDRGTVSRERRWDLISPGAELGRTGPFFALSRPKRLASIASAPAWRNRFASSHHIEIDEHEIDEHEIDEHEIVSPTDLDEQDSVSPYRGGGHLCPSLGRRKGGEGPGTTEFRTWGDEVPTS